MQEMIVPVDKAILCLTKDALNSVANQTDFGFRCGCELISNHFMKQNIACVGYVEVLSSNIIE